MPIPAGSTSPLVATLAEFKKHINKTDSNDDAELTDHLAAASEWIERHIDGPLAVQPFTERVRLGQWITPAKRPLISVTSLTPDNGTPLDPSVYVVDTRRGAIEMVSYCGRGSATLVYTAGLSVIPDRIKLAGLILAGHLWQTQNGGGGLPVPGEAVIATYGRSFAVPNRVMELLAYDTIPGIA